MNDSDLILMRPIGRVLSPFTSKEGVPIQTAGAPEVKGEIEVFAEFAAGLKDLADFEYIILLTRLHLGTDEPLEVVPFLDDASHGVFATRSPSRPNRIGLSIVRLTGVDGTRLSFEGNDMVDGTPVLDIKPYLPAFDVRHTERIGWFAGRLGQLPGRLSDDRMG
ncbi:tRNA (N6-threonylcarbamoyladenosine(37)-N6)-methyltransferase TrmO [Thauera sp.]|uniref:tRNA (N6-threonylcarbamoyladenosine(37)-N6)-methyltransferase TrmO n=1 Tax=Thauera sp. TaxID=1905334 RepID=UPI0039E4420B